MPKIKKVKELKSKIKLIEEIKSKDLVEDIKKAEKEERRNAVFLAKEADFKSPSLVLESSIEEPTQIQQETKERIRVQERNVAMRETLGETTPYVARTSDSDYQPYVAPQAAARLFTQAAASPQEGQSAIKREALQPERIERVSEREEYQTRRQKKRYPWET